MANQGEAGGGEDRSGRSATGKVKHAAHEAQEKVSKMAADAREKGGDLADEGKEKAQELAHRAGDAARSRASEEKGRVAEGIRTVADALRRGSEDLPEDRQSYGRFVDAVAGRAEDLSRYLEEHDVDEMAREAKRFAREHTAVVLSGAFALGMLGARFLKSSTEEGEAAALSRRYAGSRDFGGGYATSGGYAGRAGRPGGYARGDVHHAAADGPMSGDGETEELLAGGRTESDFDVPGSGRDERSMDGMGGGNA